MTDQHPISVPDELLRQWCQWNPLQTPEELWRKIANNSAQWGADQQLKLDAEQINQAWQKGADQELDACCEWLGVQETRSPKWFDLRHDACALVSDLRAARRPKPPIKADQALAVLDTAPKAGTPTVTLDIDQFDTILLALGRMKELEAQP